MKFKVVHSFFLSFFFSFFSLSLFSSSIIIIKQ